MRLHICKDRAVAAARAEHFAGGGKVLRRQLYPIVAIYCVCRPLVRIQSESPAARNALPTSTSCVPKPSASR